MTRNDRLSTSLWDWARQAYGRPGVEAACLALQDEHGQCVSLLLWALWAGRDGYGPSSDAMGRAVTLATAWDRAVIGPLRAARRGAKAPVPGLDDEGRQALRDRIKADELRAERLLLAALEAIQAPPEGSPSPALEALRAITGAWDAPPPPISALERLAGPFSGA